METNYPYAIKNQRGASKKLLVGGFLRSKAPSRGSSIVMQPWWLDTGGDNYSGDVCVGLTQTRPD